MSLGIRCVWLSLNQELHRQHRGEGGLIIINDVRFVERAEIIREKGVNRSYFFRGMVDKCCWVGIGRSYLPCELHASYL